MPMVCKLAKGQRVYANLWYARVLPDSVGVLPNLPAGGVPGHVYDFTTTLPYTKSRRPIVLYISDHACPPTTGSADQGLPAKIQGSAYNPGPNPHSEIIIRPVR